MRNHQVQKTERRKNNPVNINFTELERQLNSTKDLLDSTGFTGF